MICATAAATCLAHRASGGALWLIPLAAFLLGLGLQEKLTFAWGYPQVAFGYARTSAGVTDSSAVFASRMEQFRRLLDGQFTAGF